MTVPRSNELKSLELILADIRALHGPIEQLIRQFRQVLRQAYGKQARANKRSGEYWRHVAFTDSLVRIRLFVEQNFNYIESMGLLAVTRYLFEITVWLKLMQKDSRYGLVYYHSLLAKQLDFYTSLRDHLVREVAFLREMQAHEDQRMVERIEKAKRVSDVEARKRAMRRVGPDVMQEIDRTAARRFTLYGEQARTNGYSFQAHLVETKHLPYVRKSIDDLKRDLERFVVDVPPDAKRLAPKRWRWKDQAALVDLTDEYDFIYSYTSKLLHATPASLTTDQKNLEPDEMRIFLKYVHIRLLDIREMGAQLLVGGTDSGDERMH